MSAESENSHGIPQGGRSPNQDLNPELAEYKVLPTNWKRFVGKLMVAHWLLLQGDFLFFMKYTVCSEGPQIKFRGCA